MPDNNPPDKNPLSPKSKFNRLKDFYFEKKRLEFAKKANANPASYSMTKEQNQVALQGLKKIIESEGVRRHTGRGNSPSHYHSWIPENNKPLARRKRKPAPRRKR